MTGAEVITAILEEGGFDVSRATALRWANDRLKRSNRRAEWAKASISIGETVEGIAEYSIPVSALVVKDVYVGSRPYTRVGPDTLAAKKHSGSSVDYVYAPDWTSAAVEQIELFPVPETSGDEITGVAILMPTLVADTTAEVTSIPDEFHEEILVDGAIATGLARIDERIAEADRYEAKWEVAVERMRRLKTSRIGSGPVQFRVVGYHT